MSIKYKDPKQYREGSVWYVKAVLQKWGIKFDPKYRQEMLKIRKKHHQGREKGLAYTYHKLEEATNYLNAMKVFYHQIKTGNFEDSKEREYVLNYISGLQKLGIDTNLIDMLQNNPQIILSNRLPKITEFYIPSDKKYRKRYHEDYYLSVQSKDRIEQDIEKEIKEHWYYGPYPEEDKSNDKE